MSTQQNNDGRDQNERESQQPERGQSGNQWQGDESQRLSNYDQGNDEARDAQHRDESQSRNRDDESRFENNSGFNSDSSRTMDARDTDAAFENDETGQRMDDMADDETRQARPENTDTENRDRSNQRYHSEDDRNRDL